MELMDQFIKYGAEGMTEEQIEEVQKKIDEIFEFAEKVVRS